MKGHLTRVIDNVKSELLNDPPDLSILSHGLDNINSRICTIDTISKSIQTNWNNETGLDDECMSNDTYTLACKVVIDNCKMKIAELIAKKEPANILAPCLPPVVIKYTGIRLATFNSAVGNSTTLSNVDNMIYLKSFLSGEALHLMYMEVNDANYQIALDLLKTLYINKSNDLNRLLVSLFKLEYHNANYMELFNFRDNFESSLPP